MPQKERPRKNRYRNTSDLSNEVQRANASGNVPPTKFKAARSRFCWARRRFAPAKCRNALLLSSKSAKLSFSQEKLLTTHYHEPTHTPSMDMRERSGSHLRNVATRKRPQRRYDQSHDRDGTAGVPSTQPALVREPTSAFSVRGGGSSCHLCSTPRSRGASAPRTSLTLDEYG